MTLAVQFDWLVRIRHTWKHITALPAFYIFPALSRLDKYPVMRPTLDLMWAWSLRTLESWRCFHTASGEQSRRHPATVLMRFFLGFDGVPVELPLLLRPASTEPWRTIRGSCRLPHKLSACVVGHGGRQHRDFEALWDFPTITHKYILLAL